MVNVFAGWCVACQQEVAIIKHAQQVLARTAARWSASPTRTRAATPRATCSATACTTRCCSIPRDNFVAPYGVNGVPETFFIGRNGDVVAARTYQLSSKWVDADARPRPGRAGMRLRRVLALTALVVAIGSPAVASAHVGF